MYIYMYAFMFMHVEMGGRKEGLQGGKDTPHLEKTRGTT